MSFNCQKMNAGDFGVPRKLLETRATGFEMKMGCREGWRHCVKMSKGKVINCRLQVVGSSAAGGKAVQRCPGIFNFRSGIFQYERQFLGGLLMTCALSARLDM